MARLASWVVTFSGTRAAAFSPPTGAAAVRASEASAWRSQSAIAGVPGRSWLSARAVIAPQAECPHTTMSVTLRTVTAYSMLAATPSAPEVCAGTRLPAALITNSSPGSLSVISTGATRASERRCHVG